MNSGWIRHLPTIATTDEQTATDTQVRLDAEADKLAETIAAARAKSVRPTPRPLAKRATA